MSYQPRNLDLHTLDNAASYYAQEFKKKGGTKSPSGKVWVAGRPLVMQDLYNFRYKDTFQFMARRIRELLDPGDVADFDRLSLSELEPRRDEVMEELLEKSLAVNPAGEHIPGKIGAVELGNRIVGKRVVEYPRYAPLRARDVLLGRDHGPLIEMRTAVKNAYWPVYAGEIEERERESGVADELPKDAQPWPVQELFALTPRINALSAIDACDAIVDRLDLGSTAPTIRGRTGTQPADPDATETGTLLFTQTMDATAAFGNAADTTGEATATANAITDDTSADATGTLGYCRMGATGTGADDIMDGSAGTTSSFNFNYNTVSIVAGATVSLTSLTVAVPQTEA